MDIASVRRNSNTPIEKLNSRIISIKLNASFTEDSPQDSGWWESILIRLINWKSYEAFLFTAGSA